MISLIWAMDKNWLIGKGNKLPWRYREDLIYFKENTHKKTVLMGDKTYQSMKYYYQNRALPYGKIYVASRDESKTYSDGVRIGNVVEFLKNNKEDLWVIGGSVVFNLAMPYADRLYITWINEEHEGDTYFKKFDLEKDFKLISSKTGETKVLNFCIYERV